MTPQIDRYIRKYQNNPDAGRVIFRLLKIIANLGKQLAFWKARARQLEAELNACRLALACSRSGRDTARN